MSPHNFEELLQDRVLKFCDKVVECVVRENVGFKGEAEPVAQQQVERALLVLGHCGAHAVKCLQLHVAVSLLGMSLREVAAA